jgi:hypothetical protein
MPGPARAPVGRQPLSEAAAMAQARREAEVARALGSSGDEVTSVDTLPRRERQPFVRKPFGGQEQKLAYPNREGFHRHWFNDEPGRILRARDAGYEQVHDEDGRPVSTVVGIGRGGQALVAFLMELPQELFEQDMAAQEMATHELLTQIGRGEHTKPGGADGNLRYAGSTRGNISIESGTNRR